MDTNSILENERKEYKVLEAVYTLSKPEVWQGVSEEDVKKHTGLSITDTEEILTRLFTYRLISQPTPNTGYMSNPATKSKLLDYAKSLTTQSDTSVTNNFHGNVGAVQNGDRNVAHVTQNNYSQQNLTDAAREIQQLLDQLAETYPTNTQSEKLAVVTKAVEKIENDPSWKNRVVSAIKSGGTEGLKELLDNPLANILLAVIEGWREAK
jgi:hypothetical protein